MSAPAPKKITDTVPTDALLHIASFLSEEEQARLLRVSRVFRDVMATHIPSMGYAITSEKLYRKFKTTGDRDLALHSLALFLCSFGFSRWSQENRDERLDQLWRGLNDATIATNLRQIIDLGIGINPGRFYTNSPLFISYLFRNVLDDPAIETLYPALEILARRGVSTDAQREELFRPRLDEEIRRRVPINSRRTEFQQGNIVSIQLNIDFRLFGAEGQANEISHYHQTRELVRQAFVRRVEEIRAVFPDYPIEAQLPERIGSEPLRAFLLEMARSLSIPRLGVRWIRHPFSAGELRAPYDRGVGALPWAAARFLPQPLEPVDLDEGILALNQPRR
jgi:hypothetical protein